MLEHTSTFNTLYFLYLAHSLARRRLAKSSLFSCLRTLSVATGRRETLYYESFPHPFPSHGGCTLSSPQKTVCATADQRRVERSKSTETGSPSGGSIWTVAKSEMKASAGKSNSRVAPVRKQGP